MPLMKSKSAISSGPKPRGIGNEKYVAVLGAGPRVAKVGVQVALYVFETSEFLDFNGRAEIGGESLGL